MQRKYLLFHQSTLILIGPSRILLVTYLVRGCILIASTSPTPSILIMRPTRQIIICCLKEQGKCSRPPYYDIE